MVTGWPEVRLTPYIGAVVLYVVLHSRDGARSFGGLHCAGAPLLSLLLLVLLALAAASTAAAAGFVLFLISAGVVLAGLAGASFTAVTACCCCDCFLLLALTGQSEHDWQCAAHLNFGHRQVTRGKEDMSGSRRNM